eukprot:3478511-Prymnesium_polylepis.1
MGSGIRRGHAGQGSERDGPVPCERGGPLRALPPERPHVQVALERDDIERFREQDGASNTAAEPEHACAATTIVK